MKLSKQIQHYLAEGVEEKYAFLKKKFPNKPEAKLKNLAEKIDKKLINVNIQQIKDEDIDNLIKDAETTKSKREGKTKGVEGLVEGKDYIKVKEVPNAYIPLNHHASKILACGAKWCTAENKSDFWDKYVHQDQQMLIYITEKNKQIAILYSRHGAEAFDEKDNSIEVPKINFPIEKYYAEYLKIPQIQFGKNYKLVTKIETANEWDGDLDLRHSHVKKIPSKINGNFTIAGNKHLRGYIPNTMTISGDADFSKMWLKELPDKLTIGGSLNISENASLQFFPRFFSVGKTLDASLTSIKLFPEKLLTINGDLLLDDTLIEYLPDNLTVKGSLSIAGCPNIERLPQYLKIQNDLILTDTNIKTLPLSLKVGGKTYMNSYPAKKPINVGDIIVE